MIGPLMGEKKNGDWEKLFLMINLLFSQQFIKRDKKFPTPEKLSGPIMSDGMTAERWVPPDSVSRISSPKVGPDLPRLVLEVLGSGHKQRKSRLIINRLRFLFSDLHRIRTRESPTISQQSCLMTDGKHPFETGGSRKTSPKEGRDEKKREQKTLLPQFCGAPAGPRAAPQYLIEAA